MLKKTAAAIVGGLAKPSKMPGKAYGLPALECKVGGALRNVTGSTCSDCYALKGQYRFRNVQEAQYRRLASLTDPQWTDAMVTLISNETWFRWHDSGDIQDMAHLLRIVEVCERTPYVHHWLPTREKALIKAYRRAVGKFPTNLTVRVSDALIDAGSRDTIAGTVTSGVTSDGSHTCPAYAQGGECRDCRACWDMKVQHVDYPKH